MEFLTVRKIILPLLGLIASMFFTIPATAQQIDNTQILPDAKPGECYAKVITPAQFITRTEEVTVQEASERIETIEAKYEKVDQTIVVKEPSQLLTVVPARFKKDSQKIEVLAAGKSWTSSVGNKTMPASPDALEHITRSGIDINAVDAGACFVEYYEPAKYKTEAERVIIKPSSEAITVIAAVYESVEQQVVVKEASSEVVDVPAIYRTQTESVLVEPARSVWKEDCGLVEQLVNATGETLCLVEVPARYETLTKTVLDRPATTKTINIPAAYKTIKVQRLVQPASEKRENLPAEYSTVNTRVKVSDPVFFWLAKGESPAPSTVATGRTVCLTERPAEYVNVVKELISNSASIRSSSIPARYQTVEIQRLLTPASERRIAIPARTKTVSSQVQTAPAKVEWRKVVCRANLTRELVISLQRALKREGFNPGPIDGLYGKGTVRAIELYQIDQGIDRGGITYEVLQRLKIQS
jgi:hypothetical protein